jgi:hypothetical protein
MKCKAEATKKKCACTVMDCPRRGICCECLRAHVAKKSLPACLRELDWLEVKA